MFSQMFRITFPAGKEYVPALLSLEPSSKPEHERAAEIEPR